MSFDTIQRFVHEVWTVDEDGNGAELQSQIVSWGCNCGTGFPSWSGVVDHVKSTHSPDAIAKGNGMPSDATSVGTFHQVELETPDAN